MVKGRIYQNQRLYDTLLAEYVSVCGGFGIEIFEEKVLSDAFEYLEHDSELLAKRVHQIIENAASCKPSQIDSYLQSVKFERKKPNSKNLTEKTESKSQVSLEKSVRRLRGWLEIYNESRYP